MNVEYNHKYPVSGISGFEDSARARQVYEGLEDLAASIKSKGIIQPIVIDQAGKLLAGGRRLAASKLAGLDTVPVTIHEVDEVQAAEIELFENMDRKDLLWHEQVTLHKKLWDFYEARLRKDKKKLTLDKFAELTGIARSVANRSLMMYDKLELVPGLRKFDTHTQAENAIKAATRDIKAEAAVKAMDEQIQATPSEARRPTDGKDDGSSKLPSWVLDAYQVGDFLTAGRKLKAGSFSAAEVDPPYAIDLTGTARSRQKGKEKHAKYTEVEAEQYMDFLQKSMQETYRLLMDDSFCIWWFGITWCERVRDTLRETGFSTSDVPAIWSKGYGQATNPVVNLANGYETFFLARKGSPQLPSHWQGRTNVFSFDQVRGDQKYHATQKPIELLREMMDMTVPPNGNVLVPFLGSGVTISAAANMRRKAYGFDLSKDNRNLFLAAASDYRSAVYIPK